MEEVLAGLASRRGTVLIDCVTLWITNLMLGLGGGPELDDREILSTVDRAIRADPGDSRVIWVSNEVGGGLVPTNALARRFADLQGLANQLTSTAATKARKAWCRGLGNQRLRATHTQTAPVTSM